MDQYYHSHLIIPPKCDICENSYECFSHKKSLGIFPREKKMVNFLKPKKNLPTRTVIQSKYNFDRVSESYIFIFQNKTPDRLKIGKLKFLYTLIRIFFYNTATLYTSAVVRVYTFYVNVEI